MRAVLQRVSAARVEVEDHCAGMIEQGLLVLLAVHQDDTDKDLHWLVNKTLHLRIFDDQQGQMNLSLLDVQGKLLVVSQFTLYGDCRKGRRPSWASAAPPDKAKAMYAQFIKECRKKNVVTETGTFQAHMQVSLTNDGPVTMLLDSNKHF
ncbi:MAG: D-tyrosyl-tRNA(Tyr) deacylase [Desulfobulbus propionicus]|nr:MAG: D-tyrosyl-tRNA(Tyr) deacylase [Desulfobulbus propionicus]